MVYRKPNVTVFFDEVLAYFAKNRSIVVCNCTTAGSRVCHGA